MTLSDNKPSPLSASVIAESYRTSSAYDGEIEVHVLQTVDSTNTWLLERDCTAPVTLCAAEHQTVGRGRRGKTWHSPDSGVTFSMRFDSDEPVVRFSGLSLLVGAALCDALRDCGVTDCLVKWPNDVLVNDAKLAGILIESRTAVSGAGTTVVIGIGVNYKRGEEARLIDQASIDLSELFASQGLPDRSELIAAIAARLVPLVSNNVPQLLNDLVLAWPDYDALAGVEVTATVADADHRGRASGIDHNGGLRVETDSGMRVFASADVTIRKDSR